MRKRRLGEGVLGRFCGRKRRTDLSEKTKWMIWKAEAADQFRPYFTWWITFVQIAVCLASLLLYGMAPNVSQGLSRVERQKNVLHSSLTYKVVAYWEPTNVWLGPRFADLILLGAKYTPCMRTDRKIEQLIERERREENKTGCCIYNDGAGCFQSSWQACPSLLAAHIKWPSSSPASGGRSAGAVCGQDPAFCQDLVDVRTGERKSDWPDDLTRWPICQKPRQPNETMSVMVATSVYPHMTCDSTAVRPCCIQLQGQCRMATREYCDFVRGHFHEEARLCSQVSCMEDVCGLTGFFLVGKPDQRIRLVTSLFLHAGLVHVALSAFLQYWLMADLEKMIGVGRMATLYLVSGTLANLASTIFVPYNPEVGPIGSQMSLVAALFLDVIYYRSVIVAPHKEVFKLLLVVILALFAGTVPWIDNWASAFGLIYGFPLAIVLIPRHPIGDDDEEEEEGGGGGADYDDDKVARAHEDREKRRRLKRLKVVVVCMAFIGFLTAVLVLLFIRGTLDCAWCVNVNCHDWPARVYAAILNFTKDETQDERLHFCDNKGQRLVSLLPI